MLLDGVDETLPVVVLQVFLVVGREDEDRHVFGGDVKGVHDEATLIVHH